MLAAALFSGPHTYLIRKGATEDIILLRLDSNLLGSSATHVHIHAVVVLMLVHSVILCVSFFCLLYYLLVSNRCVMRDETQIKFCYSADKG